MPDDDSTDSNPEAVRSLAVTTEDVVAAYEARQRSSRETVLRATPPFSGRMRARLHESGPSDDAESDGIRSDSAEQTTDVEPETGALHVPPSRFVAESSLPAYPDPDDTEDALREDPEAEFSVERHRERHVEAVEAWRESVREAIRETVELRVPEGTHEAAVKTLGDDSGE